jgi:hypothetical protein
MRMHLGVVKESNVLSNEWVGPATTRQSFLHSVKLLAIVASECGNYNFSPFDSFFIFWNNKPQSPCCRE